MSMRVLHNSMHCLYAITFRSATSTVIQLQSTRKQPPLRRVAQTVRVTEL